jgi:acetylornithine deacetylase/succinyl-diaminopimelate desuccinylase-like protein
MDSLHECVEQHKDSWLQELSDFLRIPSISTSPEHTAEVKRGAQFALEALKRAGIEHTELIETAGHPLVYGEQIVREGAPTVLCYGHYDVQPPDPLEEWKTPPFEPAIHDGNIYARGAADDKGQVMIQLKAVEALRAVHGGQLPLNLKFIFEGEEETGGHAIEAFVPAHTGKLRADVALICDTALFAPDLPTLCIGLRGLVYVEIEAEGASHDLHSGLYGGVAPNPFNALAWIIAGLKRPDGKITIPGIYDDVVPPSRSERASWKRLPFDAEKLRAEEVGAPALVGEKKDPLERMWARPTLDVHGMPGGYTAAGAKTVIPARARAKVSIRLVPNQQPQGVIEALRRRVEELAPEGVKVTIKLLHQAVPLLINPDDPCIKKAAKVFRQVFGRKTVFVRSGGSIPVVALLCEQLKLPAVMMGFGLPDDNLHAPNEKFSLSNFFRGVETVAKFFESIAEGGTAEHQQEAALESAPEAV